jgi:hypothetical protein
MGYLLFSRRAKIVVPMIFLLAFFTGCATQPGMAEKKMLVSKGSIQLSPTAGLPEAKIAIIGASFKPGEKVTLELMVNKDDSVMWGRP